MAIPLLNAINIENMTITADALNTQRKLAIYLVEVRKAHYHFTVKGNQPNLLADLDLFFKNRGAPDFVEITPPDHGRIETRRIWTTTELNDCLEFPHVGQAFVIERETIIKKTGKVTHDQAYGITSRHQNDANPRVIAHLPLGGRALVDTMGGKVFLDRSWPIGFKES